MKQCSKCFEIKDELLFNTIKSNRLKPYCKSCDSKRNKELYPKRKQKMIETVIYWRAENWDYYLQQQKDYNDNRRKKK
jgi:hypothetical protein